MLINIWASWCPPCRQEMPQLSQLQAKAGGPDFTVITITQDDTMQRAQEFMAAIGIRNLPVYHDRSKQFGAALNIIGLPMTVLVDKAAQIRAFIYGAYAWDSVEVVELITYFVEA
jgi:thiol-disulfide isomerase/thioredoxin